MSRVLIGHDEPPSPRRPSESMHLVIGYDGEAAARSAIAVAGALFPGARATVATIQSDPAEGVVLPAELLLDGLGELREYAVDAARETAAEGASLARDAGLVAVAEAHPGPRPWRGLRALAERECDLLVCGTRGVGAMQRVALGSTASSLVHHAIVPTLVVPAHEVALNGPVVAGWDGSAGAHAALEFAALHLPRRELIVAHGYRSPVRHTLRGRTFLRSHSALLHDYADAIDSVFRDLAESSAEEGAQAARALGLRAQACAYEADGGDWHALLRGALETGAAAVLVGTRGLGAAAATVLGSVASGLMHAAALPVLVVPS
jgi:nucleotide-binding universal stress UspA family protein